MKKPTSKIVKRVFTACLCILIVLSGIPLNGFVGLELPNFPEINFSFLKASATTRVLDNGKHKFSITDEQTLTVSFAGVIDESTINGSRFYVPETIYYNEKSYSVVSVSSGALKGTSITSVVIPDTVTTIGNSAFENCTALASIDLGKVQTIGAKAFNNTALTEIKIPTTLKETATGYYNKYYGPFAGAKITTVTFEEGLSAIPTDCFSGCKELTTIGEIPETVTVIEDNAFFDCEKLTSVTFPESLITIGAGAFSGCGGLISIVVSDNVTTIGNSAFENCTALASIDLGKVQTIGAKAFNNTALTEIKIPTTLKETATGYYNKYYGPFAGAKITTVTFEEGLTAIPADCFSGCKTLTTVGKIPEKVTVIEDNAFFDCENLTSITFSERLVTIGVGAFSGCGDLISIAIPDMVTAIGDRAFENCEALAEIDLGKVQTIGAKAFNNTAITTVKIPATLEMTATGYYDKWYGPFAGAKITTVTFEEGLTAIPADCFSGCKTLTTVGEIPETVTVVEDKAFFDCESLESIKLPENLIHIGSNAFAGNDNIEYIIDSVDSDVCEYLINNEIGYTANIKDIYDSEEKKLDYTKTSYKVAEDTNTAKLEINYAFKETLEDKIVVSGISVKLPSQVSLVKATLDGKKINADISNGVMNFSATQTSGLLVLEVAFGDLEYLMSYSKVNYTYENTEYSERIEVINVSENLLTVNVYNKTNIVNITVSGVTVPNSYVDIYIDGKKITTVYSNASGSYSEEVLLEDISEGKEYNIKVSSSNKKEVSKETIYSTKEDRYVILVVDTMPDRGLYYLGNKFYTISSPLYELQKSAKVFMNNMHKLGESDGSETNYALISFSTEASTELDFTKDLSSVHSAIESLSIKEGEDERDGSNYYAAFEEIEQLVDAINNPVDNIEVVIFTMGMPHNGEYSGEGRYTSCGWNNIYTNIGTHAYANAAYNKFEQIKDKCNIYSIGFFENVEEAVNEYSGSKRLIDFMRTFVSDIQTNGFVEINSSDDINQAFETVGAFVKGATEFTYSDSNNNYKSYCFYSDNYFNRENSDPAPESTAPYWYDNATDYYNPKLATMSLALAMSAYANPKAQLSENEDKQSVNQYDNVEKLLTDIGFGHIKNNVDFENIASTNTIGDIIALRKADTNADGKDEAIIAVAIRGGNYKMEWAGNFNVGETGYHEGFKLARNRILLDLNEYLKSNEDEIGDAEIKLWITGYSRAGATANLVGAALDDYILNGDIKSLDEVFSLEKGEVLAVDEVDLDSLKKLKFDNIFTYCFEPPAGALKSHVICETHQSKNDECLVCTKYDNIYCVVNPADLVPFVAPAQFGFARYGITKYIPTSVSSTNYFDGKNNMVEFFSFLPSYSDYLVDDFTLYLDNDKFKLLDLLGTQTDYSNFLECDNYKLDELTKEEYSQHVFLSEMIRQISTDVFENDENGSGRMVYYDEYQNEIIEVVKILNKMTETQKIAFVKSFIENFVSNKSDDIIEDYAIEIVESYLYAIPYVGEVAMAIEVIELLSKMYIAIRSQSLEIYGVSETLYEYLSTALDMAIKSDSKGLREYSTENIESLCDCIETLVFKLKNSYGYLITLIPNFSSVAQAHYADLTFSWLASMDENYYQENTVLFNSGAYRILQVNCDVNVNVYDSNDVLVASIVNGEVVDNESSIIAIVNQDGEKEFLLPPDEEYRVEIVGNIDGETVNCNIKEYCAEVNDYTRIITYTDMPLDKGESITITLPEYSEEEQNIQNTNGTSCDYKAVDDDGKNISVSQEFKGEEAIEAYYSVIAESSNEEIGAVFGSGSRNYGDFAQLEAIEINGSTFLGWYDENDSLISSEKTFRFMVTEDVKLTGRFSNKYTVTWNVDGTTNSLEYEYGESIISQQEPQKVGYTFTGWVPAVPSTMPAEDLTFTATWSANSYDAVFNANGGVWSDGATSKTVSAEYNSQIVSPEKPTRQGYIFSRWSPDVGVMDSVNEKTFTAEWIPATDTRYTVETYTMNTEGEYEKSTQVFSGVTGETVTAEYNVPIGFAINSEKSVLNGTIAADNSLVLKIYLDRNTYTFITVVDGVSTETEYYYGSTLSEPVAPVKTGYKFVGWDRSIPSTMPANNITITAEFEIIATVKIKNNSGSKTINYGEILRLTAITTNMPADATVVWYVDEVESGEGETYNVSFENGTKTVEVKLVDSNGNVLKNASGNEIKDSESVTVKGGFFQKIISFFKNLFGMNRTVVQAIFKGMF